MKTGGKLITIDGLTNFLWGSNIFNLKKKSFFVTVTKSPVWCDVANEGSWIYMHSGNQASKKQIGKTKNGFVPLFFVQCISVIIYYVSFQF